jgi:hypothetical protein
MGHMRATDYLRLKSASRAPILGKAMHQAFEEAWSLIAARYGSDQAAAESARLRLAECVHRVTSDASMDVREIKRRALDMLLIIDNI